MKARGDPWAEYKRKVRQRLRARAAKLAKPPSPDAAEMLAEIKARRRLERALAQYDRRELQAHQAQVAEYLREHRRDGGLLLSPCDLARVVVIGERKGVSKERIAEIAGLTPEQLDEVIARIPRKVREDVERKARPMGDGKPQCPATEGSRQLPVTTCGP